MPCTFTSIELTEPVSNYVEETERQKEVARKAEVERKKTVLLTALKALGFDTEIEQKPGDKLLITGNRR